MLIERITQHPYIVGIVLDGEYPCGMWLRVHPLGRFGKLISNYAFLLLTASRLTVSKHFSQASVKLTTADQIEVVGSITIYAE